MLLRKLFFLSLVVFEVSRAQQVWLYALELLKRLQGNDNATLRFFYQEPSFYPLSQNTSHIAYFKQPLAAHADHAAATKPQSENISLRTSAQILQANATAQSVHALT